MIIKSWWDSSEIEITPVHGSINQFKRGKCWNVMCNNAYQYICLNRNGKADHAYCEIDFNKIKYAAGYHALRDESYYMDIIWTRPHRGVLWRVELLPELESENFKETRKKINQKLLKKMVKITQREFADKEFPYKEIWP